MPIGFVGRTSQVRRVRLASLVFAALALFYIVLGMFVLNDDAIYSGDIGVKFVEARTLAASGFRSLDLPYPGAFLDDERLFFAMKPPFVIKTATETQAIFPPASSVVQAAAVALGGVRGMIAFTILAGIATLWAVARMAAPELRVPTLLAVGLGGPLWFYAVSGWEHAQAVAAGAIAFALAMRERRGAGLGAGLFAGAMLGFGVTQRDEVMLLAPGLLYLLWVRDRDWRTVAAALAGLGAIVLVNTTVDVWWFGRPPAAHLRHAVHIVRGAWLGTEPGTDIPSLRPFSVHDRYETVVRYWLLGYGNDALIAAYTAGLAAALLVWRVARTSAALLVWLLAIAVLAAIDLGDLIAAPKWVPGMLRVSPFLVFALLPPPPGRAWTRIHGALVLTAVVYLLLAFGGADTTGGQALGPRLLLPLFPMMGVAAISTIRDYLGTGRRVDRAVGAIGGLLVAAALCLHVSATIPAYIWRNREDASAIMAVKGAPERIVVSDDMFTAQLLMPIYFRKVILVADSPGLAGNLAARLADARVGSVLLVARDRPTVSLAPLRRTAVTERGRFVVETWTR
jgi:hypothetical protein